MNPHFIGLNELVDHFSISFQTWLSSPHVVISMNFFRALKELETYQKTLEMFIFIFQRAIKATEFIQNENNCQ